VGSAVGPGFEEALSDRLRFRRFVAPALAMKLRSALVLTA
jgi:hypothetical protein